MTALQRLRISHLEAAINGWTWLEELTARKIQELKGESK